MEAGFEEDHDDLAEELAHIDDLAAEMDETVADLVQPMDQPVDVLGPGRLLGEVRLDDLEQVGMVLVGCLDFGFGPGARQVEDLDHARRIEPTDLARIDHLGAATGRPLGALLHLQVADAEDRPGATDLEHLGARLARGADRGWGVGHREN